MGADFLIACFWEELDDKRLPIKRPDWDKGRKFIDKLCDDMEKKGEIITEIEYLGGGGCGDLEDLPEIRKALHGYLTEVENGYKDNDRELTYLEFMPYRVFITGGMSWGDNPSEIYPAIEMMNQLNVLDETGLNPTLPDHRRIVNKIVKEKALQPLLIGIDPELDALLAKELKRQLPPTNKFVDL